MPDEPTQDSVTHEPEPESAPPLSDAASPPPPDDTQGEGEQVRDPGGRLQDIADPDERRAVARLRSARGNARKAALRDAQRDEAASPTSPTSPTGGQGAGNGSVTGAVPFDPLTTLRDLAQNAKLQSDRIRAATELARAERALAEVAGDEERAWLAVRDALVTLPPSDRMTWLLGYVVSDMDDVPSTDDEEEDGDGGWLEPPTEGGPSPLR